MASHKPLIVALVALIGVLAWLQTRQPCGRHDSCGHDHGKKAESRITSDVAKAREKDLVKLSDAKEKNWELDPKLETTKTKSGLQFQEIVVGKGAQAKPGDKVLVDYVGWTTEGRRFDSSLEPGREPMPFILGRGNVIKGWDEGVVSMKIGGIRRLYIHPDLAYGKLGAPPAIEPNATLVFMVRLLDIETEKK